MESSDESESSEFGGSQTAECQSHHHYCENGRQQQQQQLRLPTNSRKQTAASASRRRLPSMSSGNEQGITHTRNLLLGLCNNFGYVVMLSAAKDILERSATNNTSDNADRCIDDLTNLPCSTISTGAVLLADILPSLAIKLVAPFTFHGVPYIFRHSLVVLCQVSSFIIVALSTSFHVGLLGVIFASFGAGLGEVTYLSLSAHFHANVVSSWSSGTGGAGIFGALAFAVLTDHRLLALEPRNALLTMLVVPLLLLWTFARLLRSPSGVCSRSSSLFVNIPTNNNNTDNNAIASADGVRRAMLPSSSSPATTAITTTAVVFDDVNAATNYSITDSLLLDNASAGGGNAIMASPPPPPSLTLCCRMLFCWTGGQRMMHKIRPLLKYMVPLSVVYFSEYFINQGLLELLVFDCAHSFSLSPTSQYRWFQVLYQVGVFVSRSSVNLFPVRTRFMPLLALLQVLNMLFLFEESMALLQHIPHILPLIALVFYEGLLGGLAYVNTFAAIHRNVSKPNREFAMAFVALSDSVGIVLAGFSAIYAHNFICAHHRH